MPSLECRKAKNGELTLANQKANQNKRNITGNQWELKLKTIKLPEARENTND